MGPKIEANPPPTSTARILSLSSAMPAVLRKQNAPKKPQSPATTAFHTIISCIPGGGPTVPASVIPNTPQMISSFTMNFPPCEESDNFVVRLGVLRRAGVDWRGRRVGILVAESLGL